MSRLAELRKDIDQQIGARDQLLKSLEKKEHRLKKMKKHHEASLKAREFIQMVSRQTQEQIVVQLSDIVSVAMQGVFPNPYSLLLEFATRRGKTELDMFFERQGISVDPMNATGGGAIDLAAMSLQFSCWAITPPHLRRRNIMLLDEPLKWLKGKDMPEKGAEIIKEISQKLKLQIIMVSHSPELIDSADRVFEVSIKKGVSHVTATTKGN